MRAQLLCPTACTGLSQQFKRLTAPGLRLRAVGFSQERTEDCLEPCYSFIASSLVLGFLERSLLRIHFWPKFRVVFAATKNPDKYLPMFNDVVF